MDKTILVIGYVWPEPNSSAAGSHMLSLLKLFKSQGWRVVFATPAQKTEHMVDLSLLDIEAIEILLNDSTFDEFVHRLQPNYVMFDRFMMEEQFGWRVEEQAPMALRILDTEDLQSLRAARQTALKAFRNPNQADYASDLAKREVAAILRTDLALIISDFEVAHLTQHYRVDQQLLFHLPFMLTGQQLKASGPEFNERQHFVTIGNFRHAPNWDSVLYLREIWPKIRRQLPEAELHIYGSYPPKKATQLNDPKTGFLVKGWTEDALTVLQSARVCLSPLRFGAGIKGKLLDAMRANTPSVTTSIGAEGMFGDMPWPGAIADSVEEIVAGAVDLYTNPGTWTQATNRIQKLLNDRFDGQKNGHRLIQRIYQIEDCLSQHRLDNFVGSMLKHHSHRSTKFMSKWIEEKNKHQ
ncbi:glycosyltransferase family 4 protein [Aliikangiella marina]|uniref:Glycosyltransferase family 4 protein n=1 Tax=Aliikangiella marina TaxID=1712262 RepID=A0A545T6X4_9GAMM|nr:glycosyltransferase [Aliikangiella marina]TQV72938.1 glycosyltransferase family 4 protein [Aliikangiella marina]